MSLSDSMKRLVMKNPPAAPARDPRRGKGAIAGGRRAGENENPFLNARRTWNDHVGSVVFKGRMLLVAFLAALLIVLVAVGGIIQIGSQSKFIPFRVDYDAQHRPTAVGPVTTPNKVRQEDVQAAIGRWTECARTVTPDVSLQRKCIYEVYALLQPDDPAAQKMNEWLNPADGNTAFKRAESVLVNAEVKTVLPQTADTLEIDWVETTRDRKGQLTGPPVTWRLLATWYQAEVTKDTKVETLMKNPSSIYIRDFSWSRVL